MSKPNLTLTQLNQRSREVFRRIVDAYLETGSPIGSKTLAEKLDVGLSSATIRSVMADLELLGLLASKHASGGRLPTELGLRMFVDGLLEVGALEEKDRSAIEITCKTKGMNVVSVLNEASALLSGLSNCASVVVAPKIDAPLKHIEFVALDLKRALVVMVTEDGQVENRLIDLPLGTLASSLVEATNYLNARLGRKTVDQALDGISQEISSQRTMLDQAASSLVEKGLAAWANNDRKEALIVKGQARLLENVQALEDLETVRRLFDCLETNENMAKLLELTKKANGIQIFIGAQSALFTLSGCSVIAAPFRNSNEKIVGAIGIIGPTRLNYARVIPLVDYTSKVVSRLIG